MNKEEFLKSLEELLADISPAEKDEAMQYYREYFDDAGAENEADVIRELGSPEGVAHTIKEEIAGKELMVTETPKTKAEEKNEEYQRKEDKSQQTYGQQSTYQSADANDMKEKKQMEPAMIALIIVLVCLVGIPVGIPVLGTVGGLILGLFGALFGILCACIFGGIGLIIAAVAVLVAAIVVLFSAPLVSVLLIGIALILGSIGVLWLFGGIKLCQHGFPFLKDAVVSLFEWVRGLFHKSEV